MVGPRHEIWLGEGPVPMRVWKDLQKKMKMGYWMARFGFYGPKSLVQERFTQSKAVIAERMPAARQEGRLFEGENGQPVDAAKIPTPLGGAQVGSRTCGP